MKTVISKRKVRIAMAEADIDTFAALAERAKVSPQTIYNSLDSNSFTGKTLDAIARALEVRPVDLLETEGEAEGLARIAA